MDIPNCIYLISAVDSINVAFSPESMIACLRDLCKRLSLEDFYKTSIFTYDLNDSDL